MKRRRIQPSKRRKNGLHRCRTEQLEDRRLLAGDSLGYVGGGDNGSFTFADGVLSEIPQEYATFGTSLATLAMQYEAQLAAGTESANMQFTNESFLQMQNGWISIESIVSQGFSVDSLVNDLNALGAQGVSSFGRLVAGWVPLSALDSVAQLTSAGFSKAVAKPMSDVGLTTSQAVQGLNVDDAVQAYGFDGTGVTVGVLSDTFDSLGGYATDVATGDLPAGINILSDLNGGIDEGRAMAQLIYDVAPGVEMAFHTGVVSQVDFANGILALANAGADIIVDDIRHFDEPFFQDGVIAQAVNQVVAAGIPYFASQGNYADKSYESAFTDSGQTFGNTTEVMHDFDPGAAVDTSQSITIPNNSSFVMPFQWDDASAAVGGAGSSSDYNIYIVDTNGTVVASGVDMNVGGNAGELITWVNTTGQTDFNIIVTRVSGADAGLMKYVLRGSGTVNEFDTQSATSYGHSNSVGAAAVGAAFYGDTPEFGQDPPLPESFTSLGGVPILFDLAGNRLSTAENRQSPNFTAIDGTNTTFFSTPDPENDGFPNFFGTSAAAPHAAAVASLMMQKNPDLTPTEVYTILQDTAIDMETPGVDLLTGYGLIDAFEAVGATPEQSTSGSGSGGSGSINVCGVALPAGTTSFSGAVGGNFYASNHAILDGISPGQLGYDEVILNFLRGAGTTTEIPKAQYSIAVVGNGSAAWSFTNGTQLATGYERTDFYNINFVASEPTVFSELIAHDLIIILSGEDAVTGGLTASEMALWATVKDDIASAVNDRGLDLWVGASGGDAAYHDFLPTGALTTTAETGIDPLDGLDVTVEGQLLGITDAMADAADTTYYYDTQDDDLATLELRFAGETISVAAAGIAFYNDEMIPAADVPGGSTPGMVGLAFEDLNMDGYHDANEMGVAGAKFFIDYNGDGTIGLCEPTATSNAAGQFVLYTAYSGTFRVLPVPVPGSVMTTTTPVYVTIQPDGTASLSAPLEFGVISGSDSGSSGLGGSTPVVQGAYLGASPIADDGVFFGNGIKPGLNTVTITSSVMHNNVVMNAWFDWNKDGIFAENERIFTNVKLTPGQKNYTFSIPSNLFDDSSLPDFARLTANVRFRVGPTLNIGATANDAFGEIEDYKVFIKQDADDGLTAYDDVFTYQEDTADQVFNVLANDKSFFNRSLTIVPGSVTNISPVETPPLDITVSPDGTRILFDASGVMDLTQNITFEYSVQDTDGNVDTATVTLVAPVSTTTTTTNSVTPTFFNANSLPGDVNNDGHVSGRDLAKIVGELRTGGPRNLPNLGEAPSGFDQYIDVNGDNKFTYFDLLALLEVMSSYNVSGEPLEQEPSSSELISTETVPAPSVMPVVEVVTPVSNTEVITPVAPVSQNNRIFQVIASDLVIASETGDSEPVETEIVSDEAVAELAFSSLGSDQSDLLWSDSDELDFSSTEGEAEDDVFADPEWDSELLSY